jgi:hypothetical protein
MRVPLVCKATLSRLFGTRITWLCLMVFLLAAAAGAGLLSGHAQSAAPLAAPTTTASQAQAAVSAQPVLQPAVNTTPAGPQQQIAQLFQMATELKADVDKTNKDELSVTVVRKASALEQLAHKVRNAWPASSR